MFPSFVMEARADAVASAPFSGTAPRDVNRRASVCLRNAASLDARIFETVARTKIYAQEEAIDAG